MVFSGGLACENPRELQNRIVNLGGQVLSCNWKMFPTDLSAGSISLGGKRRDFGGSPRIVRRGGRM